MKKQGCIGYTAVVCGNGPQTHAAPRAQHGAVAMVRMAAVCGSTCGCQRRITVSNSLAGSQIFLAWFPPGWYLKLGTHRPVPACTISPRPPSPDLKRMANIVPELDEASLELNNAGRQACQYKVWYTKQVVVQYGELMQARAAQHHGQVPPSRWIKNE